MLPFLRTLVTAALAPLLAGCADLVARMEATAGQIERLVDPSTPRPGLEGLASASGPLPLPEPEPPPTLPVPPPAAALPFPTGARPTAEAEPLLAGDPMALRFLALKMLAEQGLAPLDEVAARKDGNIGALLPLTAPLPPAAGLDRPIPPLDQVVDRFAQLPRDKGTEATRAAERGFMLDALLPKAPAARMPLSPADQQAARLAEARLGRLREAGLITRSEHEAEAAALAALAPTLPEILVPPPPAPPPKKKKAVASGTGRGARFPGGVSGKLEVVPSPLGVKAPAVAAGFTGPVGVHLLSMGSAGHGDKAWEALKKEFPELAPLSFKVSRADLGELGATYRLVAGPLDSAAAADKLCAALVAKGQTCQPTPFPQ